MNLEFNDAENESKLRMELVRQEILRRNKAIEDEHGRLLTTSEIIDCASAVYQCDPNDVSERDIKFARHIEQLAQENL
jgi:hypothetical protein